MRSPEQLAERFRSQGLKVTPQRQLLFSLLHDNAEHPTAESLYSIASQQMPGISLRTVYQTLSDLTDMGELGQVTLDGGAVRFDPNLADHHHAVCDECGSIADVIVDHLDAVSISEPTNLLTIVNIGGVPWEMRPLHGFCADLSPVQSTTNNLTNQIRRNDVRPMPSRPRRKPTDDNRC